MRCFSFIDKTPIGYSYLKKGGVTTLEEIKQQGTESETETEESPQPNFRSKGLKPKAKKTTPSPEKPDTETETEDEYGTPEAAVPDSLKKKQSQPPTPPSTPAKPVNTPIRDSTPQKKGHQ